MRRAFTLVELLVVIFIVGVLLALLLPAVQQARESSRRLHCQNNLRQIGLALHARHNAHGAFPPGYVENTPGHLFDDDGPGWGWVSFLLPYIELGTLSDSIRYDRPVNDPINERSRTQRLAVFLCTSDSAPPTWPVTDHAQLNVLAEVTTANYVALGEWYGHGHLFDRNSRVSLRQIKDGTSQTMAVGERVFALSPATWTGRLPQGYSFYAPAPRADSVSLGPGATALQCARNVGRKRARLLRPGWKLPPRTGALDRRRLPRSDARRHGLGETDCFSGRIRDVRAYRLALEAAAIRQLVQTNRPS